MHELQRPQIQKSEELRRADRERIEADKREQVERFMRGGASPN